MKMVKVSFAESGWSYKHKSIGYKSNISIFIFKHSVLNGYSRSYLSEYSYGCSVVNFWEDEF